MMKNKKVLAIFGNVALYGQERANIQVFETLKEAGHEVLLLVNDRGFHWHLQTEIEQRQIKFKKIRFSWNLRKTFKWKVIKSYLIDIPKSNVQLFKSIKQFKPDVIHVCNDTSVITLIPALIITKTPIIYRLGDEPSSHLSIFHKFIWRKGIIKRVNRFVCNARFIENKIIALGAKQSDISIIYNYPPKRKNNITEFLPKKAPDLITFNFIGQISKEKGIDILIDAFILISKKHKKLRLLIAGDENHNTILFAELQEKVVTAGLTESIFFLGKINNINLLFNVSDVNIIPSVYEEPLSNVLSEAKNNECPSIIFPSGGLPELINHKEDGYITSSKTPTDLIEAMSYYICNRTLIKKHGCKALLSMDYYGINYVSYKNKWLKTYEILFT